MSLKMMSMNISFLLFLFISFSCFLSRYSIVFTSVEDARKEVHIYIYERQTFYTRIVSITHPLMMHSRRFKRNWKTPRSTEAITRSAARYNWQWWDNWLRPETVFSLLEHFVRGGRILLIISLLSSLYRIHFIFLFFPMHLLIYFLFVTVCLPRRSFRIIYKL